MSGSIYGTMTTASFQNMILLHASLANVLRRDYNTINSINAYYGRSNPNPTGTLWGMTYGHAGSSSFDGNVNGYRQGFSGLMAGFDRLNEREYRMGLFISAGQSSLSSDLQDRMTSNEFMVGHYYRKDGTYGYVLAQAGIGTHRYDTRRHISFGYYNPEGGENYFIDRTATNQHSAFLATAHFETGFRYRNSVLNLSPFVGAQYTGLVRQGFTEHGAYSLDLTSDLEDYHSIRTMFGLRFDSAPFQVRRGLASFYGNVAWSYEFEASRPHSEFSARFTDAGVLTGPTFTVSGNDPGRDWVQAGFGLNFDFNANVRGFTGYDAYANQRQVMHAANLGFIWQR
jgi:outer membrane autotransporter protein